MVSKIENPNGRIILSLKVTKDHVVKMHYKLSDKTGKVIDSSEGQEPLAYLHGAGNIIPGLEKELEGKSIGDQLNVVVEPQDGYGEVNPELVQQLDISLFQGVDKIEPGMVFQADAGDGRVQQIIVKEVNEDKVKVDSNHPLAGVQLHFDVNVTDIRKATNEEIQNKHIH